MIVSATSLCDRIESIQDTRPESLVLRQGRLHRHRTTGRGQNRSGWMGVRQDRQQVRIFLRAVRHSARDFHGMVTLMVFTIGILK